MKLLCCGRRATILSAAGATSYGVLILSTVLANPLLAALDPASGEYRSPMGEIDFSFLTVCSDIVDDPSAAEGRCAWMGNATRNGWYVQWPWDGRNVAPGIRYRLTVRVKARKLGDGGDAFGVGVWDGEGRKRVIRTRWIKAADIENGVWTDLVVGELVPGGVLGYFYLTSGGNPECVPDVYLDYCTLTPLPTSAQRKRLGRFLQARCEEIKADEAFAKSLRPLPQPRLDELFVFGTCVGEAEMRVHSKLFDVPWDFMVRHRLRDVQSQGCNIAFDLCTDSHSPQLRRFVEIAQEEQINLVAGQSHVIHGGRRSRKTRIDAARVRAKFEKLVPQFRELDRFLFWYLVDEPRYDQCNAFLRGKAIIEEVDGTRAAIPLMNTEETIRRLGPHQQILITDRHPMYRDGANPWCIGDWVVKARKYARGPVWMMLPAYSSRGMRMTEPSEASLMIFLALMNGAKGIVFYTQCHLAHWERPGHMETLIDPFGTPHSTWESLGKLTADLRAVGPLLMSTAMTASSGLEIECEQVSVWRGERPAIVGAVLEDEKHSSRRYLVLANNDTERPHQAVVAWPGGTPAHDLFAMTTTGASPLTVALSPGEGRIYLLGSAADFAAVSTEMLPYRYEHARDQSRPDFVLAQKHGLTGAAQELWEDAEKHAELGDYQRALHALGRVPRALAEAETPVFSEVRTALAQVRGAMSQMHRAATNAVVAGDQAKVNGLKTSLFALGKEYYGLRRRFSDGEGAAVLKQTVELRHRLDAR